MRHILLSLILTCVSGSTFAASQVIFITGFPVDIQPREVKQASADLKNQLALFGDRVTFKTIHNSKWKQICKALRKGALSKQLGDKTILVGHSYGAQATTDIARCLLKSKVTIDLAISIDMVQKPFFPDPSVIPENILLHFNFYETDDPVLQGIQTTRRVDGSERGLVSTRVLLDGKGLPHWEILSKVIGSGESVKLMTATLGPL